MASCTITYGNNSYTQEQLDVILDNMISQALNRKIIQGVNHNGPLEKLADKFGVPYEIVESDQPWKARVDVGRNVVQINVLRSTPDSAIHEYAHIFNAVIRNKEPELWKQMTAEVPDSLLDKLKKTYPDHNKEQLLDEAVAQLLGEYGTSAKKSIVKKFWDYIRDLIRQLFGYPVKITPFSTLKEVAEMLVNDGPVQFVTELNSRFGKKGNIDARRLDTVESQIGLYNHRMGTNLVELYQTPSGNWRVRAREILPSGGVKDLGSLLEKPYIYQLDADAINAYSHQLNLPGITQAQKSAAEKVMRSQMNIALDDSERFYTYAGRIKLSRVSNVLQNDPFYSFEGDQSAYENNRIWGSLIDLVLQRVILGDSLNDIKLKVSVHASADMIEDEVVEKLYNEFISIRQQFPNSILMTQIISYNLDKPVAIEGETFSGVAGSVDLLIIQGDGTFKMRDLKSSVKPFTEPYPSEDGSYTNSYDRRFRVGNTERASRMDKHRAQLSMYAYMIRSLGIPMDLEDGLGVIPVHITDEDGHTVFDINFETNNIPMLLNSDFREYEGDQVSEVENEFYQLLEKMKALLGKRIIEAKKEGKSAYFIEQLVGLISHTDALQAINAFIYDAHQTFMGNSETGFIGFAEKFKRHLREGKTSEDKMQVIAELNHIRQIIDIYNSDGIMRELKTIMTQTPEYDESSPLEMIRKVIDTLDDLERRYEKEVPGFIAEILAEYANPDAVKSAEQRIADFEKKLDKLKTLPQSKSRDRRIRILEKDIREQKERFYVGESGIDLKEMIKREITVGGYKDIGIIDRWFTPSVSIDNSFLPNFALLLKESFERVRRGTIDLVRDAREEFDKFRKTTGRNIDVPQSFNEGLFTERETYTGQRDDDGNRIYRKVLSLVAPVDYERFEAEQKAMWQRRDEAETLQESRQIANDWYNQNMEPLPERDEVIDGIVVTEGAATIKARMRARMSPRQYTAWINYNTRTLSDGSRIYTRELSRPRRSKYASSEFEKMLKDPGLRPYYFYLLKLYKEAQARVPRRYNESHNFILPFIKKSYTDRFLEGQLFSSAKLGLQRTVQRLDEDFQEEQYATDTRTIPVLYWNHSHMMNSADVSKDLLHSIVKFDVASRRYQEQNKVAPLADNLLNLVKKTAPIETDRQGLRMLSKAAKLVGIEGGIEKYKKKHGNNVAALLEAFIDTQIYGRTRAYEKINLPIVGEIDLGKVADSIIGFGSKTQIAANWLVGVANSLQARASNTIEAFGGEVFGNKDWLAAKVEYAKNSGDFIKDSLNPYNKSLIGQLIDLYEPMQGDYYNEYGKRLTQSEVKQKFSWSTAYFAMHLGEHQAQVTAMIAAMKKKKVTRIVEGVPQQISVYDAYELDKDGKIKLKSGISGITELVDRHLMNSLHATNKRLHGIYNNFDRVDAERYAAGRLILMYRKFLVPGWKKRFKAPGLDWELGGETEGTYRTFYHKIFSETKELINYLTGNESTLTGYEKANIRRAIAEHMIIITTGFIIMILDNLMSDMDDDEKEVWGYALYFAMRLNAEMSIYGAPADPTFWFAPNFNEMWAIHRSPTIAFTVIQKGMRFYYQFVNDMGHVLSGEGIERYQRDTGMFQKGDSKTYAAFLKLLGVNSKLYDAETAVNVLMLTKGASK